MEMPRCCSSAIQSDGAPTDARCGLHLRWPRGAEGAAVRARNFSVRVVLPASGWLMMAKVRRRAASSGGGGHPGEGTGGLTDRTNGGPGRVRGRVRGRREVPGLGSPPRAERKTETRRLSRGPAIRPHLPRRQQRPRPGRQRVG